MPDEAHLGSSQANIHTWSGGGAVRKAEQNARTYKSSRRKLYLQSSISHVCQSQVYRFFLRCVCRVFIRWSPSTPHFSSLDGYRSQIAAVEPLKLSGLVFSLSSLALGQSFTLPCARQGWFSASMRKFQQAFWRFWHQNFSLILH